MRAHHGFRAAAILFVLGCITSAQLGCDGFFGPLCDPGAADGQPGSCPDKSKEPGTQQGECAAGFGGFYCEDGLSCVDGACIPCGGDNQICCSWDGPIEKPACNAPTLACYHDPNQTWATCTSSCGTDDQPCCPDGSCAGTCMGDGPLGMPWCVGSDSGTCNTGPEHFVWVSDPYGCVTDEYKFHANTTEEAQACADARLALYDSSYSLLPLDTDRDCEPYLCQVFQTDTYSQLTNICGSDQQTLDTCAQSLCIDCDSWSFDICPKSP